MTAVTVVRDRYVRGWPRHEGSDRDRAYVCELSHGLTRPYSTDAHFAAYETPNGRRLTREAIDQGVALRMTALTVDVDCPETHGSSEPAPSSWRETFDKRFEELASVHPGAYAYHTRGGARGIWGLAEPFVISSQADARTWSQHYAVALAYLLRRFGIAADPACHDWQRLYRLPRATREPGGRPESWPTLGDPHRIGTFSITASAEDLEIARRTSKAFRQSTIVDCAPCPSSGTGLLYELLRARGDILREHHQPGAYVVRCPQESEHSTGRTGDGSTLLYLPASGAEVGALHCLHAHCQGLSVRDWLSCFTDTELEDGRRAAGIARVA